MWRNNARGSVASHPDSVRNAAVLGSVGIDRRHCCHPFSDGSELDNEWITAKDRREITQHNPSIFTTIRSKAKLLLHGMKPLCYCDPAAFNSEVFGKQEAHHGIPLDCGDNIQTDCVGS